MNNLLLEETNLKVAMAPHDADTVVAGARVSLAKGESVAIIINLGTSTGAAVVASLQQHNAASGGTSKALEIDNPIFHKKSADTVFTKVEPSAKASSFDYSTQFASDSGLLVLEVKQEDLDVNGDFTHISVDLADATVAKLVSAVYAVEDARNLPAYAQAL